MSIYGGAVRGLAALLICAVAGLPALVAPPSAAATTSAESETDTTVATSPTRTDDGLAVRLTSIEPAVLGPGDELDLGVQITNTSGATLRGLQVDVAVQNATPISRFALHSWTHNPQAWATTSVLSMSVPGSLRPAQTTSVTLRVPPQENPTPTAWGPRGVEVSVAPDPQDEEGAISGSASGSARTWLVVDAPEDTPALPLAAVVPLTPTARELSAALEDSYPGAELVRRAAPRIAEAAERLQLPGVTLAVDPAILAEHEPTEAPGAESEQLAIEALTAAQRAKETLRAPRDPRSETLLLPLADPSIAALAHSAHPEILQDTVDAAQAQAQASGLQARTDVLAPAGAVLDAHTMRAAAAAGFTAVVGTDTFAPASSAVTWTPSARADLVFTAAQHSGPTGEPRGAEDAAGVSVPAILGDAYLSQLAAGALPTGPQLGSATALDPVEARQFVLAETAVIQRERPNDPRVVGIVVDRALAHDPRGVQSLSQSLAALADASWLEPQSLSQVLGSQATGPQRRTLPASVPAATDITPAVVNDLARSLQRVQEIAQASSQPEALLIPAWQRSMMLLSHGWRGHQDAHLAATRSVRVALANLPHNVTVAPSSTINLLATSAELPVRVTNALPVAMEAHVHLDPPDARLSAPESVPVTIPALGEATALVPVQARGSGNVELTARLTTPSGLPLGDSTLIDVRLRADWEGRGAVIGGVILTGVVVVGIVRTVRRTRRRAEAG